MQEPEFFSQLTDPIQQLVARNIWNMFLFEMEQKQVFFTRRNEGELNRIRETQEWTVEKKRTHLASLLEVLDEIYSPYGLDIPFYRCKFWEESMEGPLWEKFIEDWRTANEAKLSATFQQEMEALREQVIQRIQRSIVAVPEYIKKREVDIEEFTQIWGTMSGRWNSVDFERMRSIVKVQQKYPILLELTQKMGRIADAESRLRFAVASGNVQQMQHSSRTDIKGITIGNDLNSLLPLELAQSSDDELDDLFLYKYVTHSLQNFSHKSEVLKPTHSLRIKPARQKGPMIVCLDTSGSMYGQPELIGQSMIVKLLELADKQERDMYLIAFSVSVNPIDVRKERARLQEFFRKTSTGDTDATKMIEKICLLLEQKPEYLSADVLWITDFKIPLVRPSLLNRILQHRREGTCFYGLRTAMATEPVWEPYFDKIYDVAIPHFRKYGK